MKTTDFRAFSLEPFPTVAPGDSLSEAIVETTKTTNNELRDGDIVVVASKVVSISERRYVNLSDIAPTTEAERIAASVGKPAALVQIILDESVDHFLATANGPIIATHRLGYRLTSAGVDRDGEKGAWLLPADPDESARKLRNDLRAALNVRVAVVVADSDGRADRRGATVISIGAAGIHPLRTTEHVEPGGRVKQQEETLTDLVTAAAGIVLGQRGRGAPVVVLRGIEYDVSDAGVAAMLHAQRDPA